MTTSTPTAIIFTLDSTGKQTGGFDYHTGEFVPLEVCDRLFVDISLHYIEGKITPLGSMGSCVTYLLEAL